MKTNETIKEIREMIKEVREMQQDLDAYNYAFVNIIGHLNGKFGRRWRANQGEYVV